MNALDIFDEIEFGQLERARGLPANPHVAASERDVLSSLLEIDIGNTPLAAASALLSFTRDENPDLTRLFAFLAVGRAEQIAGNWLEACGSLRHAEAIAEKLNWPKLLARARARLAKVALRGIGIEGSAARAFKAAACCIHRRGRARTSRFALCAGRDSHATGGLWRAVAHLQVAHSIHPDEDDLMMRARSADSQRISTSSRRSLSKG